MDPLFERTRILLGSDEALAHLAHKNVFIAGMGGVGSFIAEALGRMGVGRLMLVDNDRVARSNCNRQLVALGSTVGQLKAEVMRARLLDINPACQIEIDTDFLTPENLAEKLDRGYDYVIDAIDTLNCKIALIVTAVEQGKPVASSMGAGNKMDPSLVRVGDVFETEMCALAKVVRQRLRKRGIQPGQVKTVYSLEQGRAPAPPEPTQGGRPRAVNGTCSYLPGIFGLTLAGVVIQDLLAN